jgi:hypothetical protein
MSDVAIYLVTISHANLAEDILLSSDPTEVLSSGVRGTISNSLEYVQLPFEIVFQEQTENLLARAVIRMDNISREIMQAVRLASGSAPSVKIQIVLASDPDTVEIEIDDLKMNNIRGSATIVEADLQPPILQGEKYPKNTINQADFPGVFGAPTRS